MPYGLRGIIAAGSVAMGGQSLARAASRVNTGTKAVKAGYFVALSSEADGIQALSAVTDVIDGVVMHSNVQDTYIQDERLSVGSIGAGDGIWCVIEGDVERGNKVFIRAVAATGKTVGAVLGSEVAGETIATSLVVLNVQNGLAHVTQPVIV